MEPATGSGPPPSVTATAPVRVCDVGGWTDTWFGSPGQVCSIAVGPAVSATASRTVEPPGAVVAPVRLVAPDIGLDHRFGPHPELGWDSPEPSVEPLLEHAVAEVLASHEAGGAAPVPPFEVTLRSSVPPGASLGTSAAVVVAVLAAVRALVDPNRFGALDAAGRAELARTAHRVETKRAGREAGVQDHWASACGGALHLAIDTYPDVRPLPLDPPPGLLDAIGERLVNVVIGRHDSSAVHGEVIRAFLTCDGVEHDRVRRASRRLASLAAEAARALSTGDVEHWADVLVRSTEAQAAMHPDLVGPVHHRAIEVARAAGAVGWKVNGAGGHGGSLSVVAPPGGAEAVRRALAGADPGWRLLDLAPSGAGVTVTSS